MLRSILPRSPTITRASRLLREKYSVTLNRSAVAVHAPSSVTHVRTFADSSSNEKPSLKDTVRRMQEKDGNTPKEEDNNTNEAVDDFVRRAADTWSNFSASVGETWQELVQSGQRKSINKTIRVHETKGADDEEPYTGPVAMMVIDPSENLTAWERMQRRLTEAPIIQDILTRGEEFYEKSGAKEVKKKVDHLREDAREAWETSQNPWVYRASSVYETLTEQSAETLAVAELRELDPTFTLDDWREDVVEHTLPQIMQWLLEGRTNQLKPWLTEGVFNRIAAEIAARKKEGVQIDTHVLAIMNSEILAVEVCF